MGHDIILQAEALLTCSKFLSGGITITVLQARAEIHHQVLRNFAERISRHLQANRANALNV